MYRPERERLFHLREEIAENGQEFLDLMATDDFKSTFQFLGDQLKRIPKGFDKEHPMENWIRHKDFLVQHEAPLKMIGRKDMLDYAFDVFEKMKPFNDYVNKPLALKE